MPYEQQAQRIAQVKRSAPWAGLDRESVWEGPKVQDEPRSTNPDNVSWSRWWIVSCGWCPLAKVKEEQETEE